MTIFCQKRIYDDLTGAQSGNLQTLARKDYLISDGAQSDGLANFKLWPEKVMLHQPGVQTAWHITVW